MRSSPASSLAARESPAAAAAATGPVVQGREFVWTDADFSRVQALIYQRAGINLHDGKHAMVYSRLSRRLRDTGQRIGVNGGPAAIRTAEGTGR